MDNKEQDIALETENIHADFGKLIATGPSLEETVFDLTEIRKSRGFTFNDLSSLTKISPYILKAIEQQSFDLLPVPFYARSFIKMYMKVLNIEDEKILSRYDQYLKRVESDNEEKYPTAGQRTLKKRHPEFWMLAIVVAVMFAALVGYF